MKTPYRDILAALHLTRAGKVGQATTLLQRALRGTESPLTGNDVDVRDDDIGAAKEPVAALAGEPATRCEPVVSDVPRGQATRVLDLLHVSQAHAQPRGKFAALTYHNKAGTRTYKLFVPSNYRGQACALVVMLHGCTQSADDFAAGTRMNAVADEMTCFVAYPEQSASANSSKCWNWFSRRDQERDRGEPSLVAGITRQIMSDYSIDEERVYIAGMSAGGAAAAVLAATYSDMYAALGVHSGLACGIAHNMLSAFAAMKNGGVDARTGKALRALEPQSRPTIVFHGDLDSTVNPRNADRFTDDVSLAQCAKESVTRRAPGGLDFTQTTYTDVRGRCLMEQWVIHGAGHAWSGGSPLGSYTEPQGPDASREMLRFFLSHTLGTKPNCLDLGPSQHDHE